MTMRIAVVAAVVLAVIAMTPGRPEQRARQAMQAARQAFMRGVVTNICPDCCEIIDGDGFSTPLRLNAATQVAGVLAPGDRVDAMARFTGTAYIAVSIVKTGPAS